MSGRQVREAIGSSRGRIHARRQECDVTHVRHVERFLLRLPPTHTKRDNEGCNSSNPQVAPPLTEEEKATAREAGGKAALRKEVRESFEAALEEADEDQDKVVALAEAYSNVLRHRPPQDAGRAAAQGFYTKAESIFEALMPRGDGGIAPSSCSAQSDQGSRRKAQGGDDRRGAAQLRLPRRQDLERDEPRRL